LKIPIEKVWALRRDPKVSGAGDKEAIEYEPGPYTNGTKGFLTGGVSRGKAQFGENPLLTSSLQPRRHRRMKRRNVQRECWGTLIKSSKVKGNTFPADQAAGIFSGSLLSSPSYISA